METSRIRLSEAIKDFLQTKGDVCSSHTIGDYALTMRRLNRFFLTDPYMTRITSKGLRDFLRTIPGGQKNRMNAFIALSSFYTFCVKQNYVLKHLPRLYLEKPKPPKVEIHPFSLGEIESLLNATDRTTERDRAIVVFLLDTGLRASELCDMKPDDIQDGKIRVMGKGRKERYVPISPDAMLVLAEYYRHGRKSGGDNVFQTDDGKHLTRYALALMLRRMGDRAGVPECHAHRFRHTFAVNFLLNGGDAFTLQRILGHASATMTNRYLALTKADLERVHAKASPVKNWGLEKLCKHG